LSAVRDCLFYILAATLNTGGPSSIRRTRHSVVTRTHISCTVIVCGSFQKFCTVHVFSLKMNLFYKIHLHAFNIISIVLYHSGPTFGKVLYSCLDAFVVDASDCSGHLIRHLFNASEAFPRSGFLNFGNKSKSGRLSPSDFDLFRRNHS
jgi:hypothetical protein